MTAPALVLDVETTGLNPATARVIEIAIIDWSSGDLLLHSYIDPEEPISAEITAINGITNEMVAGQPKFRDLSFRVYALISNAIAVLGYNPFFDRGMIDSEFSRLDKKHDLSSIETVIPPWPILVCGKRLWDVYEPREERNLQNAYRRFVDRAGFKDAHTAVADTMATRDLIRSQIATFDLSDTSWEDMDPERKLWFGPSSHVLWQSVDYSTSGLNGVRRQLVCNFGKNRGTPVIEVDVGFWRWVRERDFPDHVVMLAIKMMDFSALRGTDLAAAVTTWAEGYVK